MLIVLAAAAVAWTVVADNLSAAQPPGADWSRPSSIQGGGITAYYPRAWSASVRESTLAIESGATRIMLVDYGPCMLGTSHRGPITSSSTTTTAGFCPASASKVGT